MEIAARSKPAAPATQPAKKAAGNQSSAPAASAAASKSLYYVNVIRIPPSNNFVGRLSAKDLIPLLGNIDPYVLKDLDADTLILYRSSKTATQAADDAELKTISDRVNVLAPGHATAEFIEVPHGASIENMLKAITDLIPDKNITVTADGADHVRVVRAPGVAQADYDRLKEDIRRIGWQMKMESSVDRVFYVNAADVSAALGGKGGSASGGAGSSGSKTDGATQSQSEQSTTTTINQLCLPATPAATPAKADATANSASQGSSSAANSGASPASAKDNSSGQQSTPCAVTTPAKPATSESKSGAESSSPTVSVAAANDDLLVFSTLPGHDADISEKKRLLATLDFPRPEVLLNIWSFQTSSSNIKTITETSAHLQATISEFNNAIQESIDKTWTYLQSTLNSPDKFDSRLYPYLTMQYVGTGPDPLYIDEANRKKLGICPATEYCLGYGSLFHPLKPTLTDMLLESIVSTQPGTVIRQAIRTMEGDYAGPANGATCEQKDQGQTVVNDANSAKVGIPIHCFEEEAELEFPQDDQNSRAGILRAALANFLFHYKMSQQYPHEFSSYDLTQSAQELNSELNPLILAFNRDLSAMLGVLSNNADLKKTKNDLWGFGGHGSTFINNGVITARTLSGKSTTVDTVTQSVFDATTPPSITDLVKAVGDAQKNIPTLLKADMTANEAAAVLGALNSVAPAQSKIGREFKINITPRSLSGASSAELAISLDAKESAEPTLYSNGKSSSDNISRVATHNVETKVRLESIKLFEISSFSAYLERSRRNIPILPPFFELPYVGSILSLPMPGAKEYHRSTAVISAIVVPTATDIVSGIRFNFDRVTFPSLPAIPAAPSCSTTANGTPDHPCSLRVALSMSDLSAFSISAFHRAKVACFATGQPFAGSSLNCEDLKLSTLYPER